MAGLTTTVGASSTGLSPQQIAAVQEAVSNAENEMGASGSYGTYHNDVLQGLTNSGDFSTAELNNLEDTGLLASSPAGSYSNIKGGNTATFLGDDTQSIDQQLDQFLSQQQTAQQATSAEPTQQELASYAPASFSQFGSVPTVAPTTYTATNVDQSTLPGALSEFKGLNAQALAPQFQAQQMSLNDNLASRGIVNSGASTYSNQELAGQQDSALASADAPLVSQFASAYTTDEQQNAAAANAANQFDAQQTNTDNLFNAETYNTDTANDEQTYNQYLATLEGQAAAYGNNLTSAYLNTYNPNGNSQALSTLGSTPTLNYGTVDSSGLSSGINSFLNGLTSLGGSSSSPSSPNTGTTSNDNTTSTGGDGIPDDSADNFGL